jgi:hypothetical protein
MRIITIATLAFALMTISAAAEPNKTECARIYPALQDYAMTIDKMIRTHSLPQISQLHEQWSERLPAYRNAFTAFDKTRTPLVKALQQHRNAAQDLALMLQLCAR